MGFRGDINGLRAVAVIAVVLFHFLPTSIPGGFAGVDVFFVISGYLMTGIIYNKAAEGRFSIAGFYVDRVRRLVPSLIFLCAVLLLWGYFELLPIDYKALGEHVVSVLLFFSNIVFYSETGYFDSASHLKWLLHTWSLSVEWQFYIVYPVVVLVLLKFFSFRSVKYALASLAVISFVVAVYASYESPSFAYYMLPARAWEMLFGGMLVLFPPRLSASIRPFIAMVGLALIVGSFFVLDNKTVWPGQWALIPVLGALLIIGADYSRSFLWNNKVVAWLGKSSYSTYLWHWPISVYLYTHELSSDPYALTIGILLSFACGLLFYATIENIARKKNSASKVVGSGWSIFRVGTFVAVFLLICASGLFVKQSNGITSRMDDEVKALSEITDVYTHFNFYVDMRGGICHSVPPEVAYANCMERREKMLFLWGDSYAAALYQGIKYVRDTKDPEYGIGQMTNGNGPPFFTDSGLTWEGLTLKEVNNARVEAVRKFKPEVIVITWRVDGSSAINDKELSLAALSETITKIKEATPTSRIVIVGPSPQWNTDLVKIVVGYWNEKKTTPPEYSTYGLNMFMVEWDRYFKEKLPPLGVSYVSAYDAMCNDDGCLTRLNGDINDLPIVDWGHLSTHGSLYLIEKIEKSIFLK